MALISCCYQVSVGPPEGIETRSIAGRTTGRVAATTVTLFTSPI